MPSSIRFSPEPVKRHRPTPLPDLPKRNDCDDDDAPTITLERVNGKSPFPAKKILEEVMEASTPDEPEFPLGDIDGKAKAKAHFGFKKEGYIESHPPIDIAFTPPQIPLKPGKPALRRLPTVDSFMPRQLSINSSRRSSFVRFPLDRRSPDLKLRDNRRNGWLVPDPDHAFGGALADLRRPVKLKHTSCIAANAFLMHSAVVRVSRSIGTRSV